MLQTIDRFWPEKETDEHSEKDVFFRDDIFSDDDLPFDFDIRSITKKILALFLSYMYLNITVYLLVDISISLVKKFIL